MIEALQKLVEAFIAGADIAHLVLLLACGYLAWREYQSHKRIEKVQSEKFDLAMDQTKLMADINLTLHGTSQTLTAILERVR